MKWQTMASKLAEQAGQQQKDTKIPPEYKQFEKVFSEEESKRFLPSREWDHMIDLKPGAPATLPAKAYRLPPDELKAMDEFLDENLKLKWVRKGKGPWASGFFFIKKKDGKLQPVQDYRKVVTAGMLYVE